MQSVTGRRQRPGVLRLLLLTAGYVSYGLSELLFLACAVPLMVFLAPFPERKARLLQAMIHRYLGFFTRGWLPLLGVYRIAEISGLEQALAKRPVVYVSNHRGRMDGILLLGLLPRTGVLIKGRDTRRAAYAFLERNFDLIGVDRSTLGSVGAAVERGRLLLQQGKNLLVFPEGTRAPSGRLQHFNLVAFELARKAGVPVVPVIVHSTLPFMARVPGSLFPRGQNHYRIRFLEPELPQPEEDAEALCDRVYRRMASELKSLDTGTVWERGSARLSNHESTAVINAPQQHA